MKDSRWVWWLCVVLGCSTGSGNSNPFGGSASASATAGDTGGDTGNMTTSISASSALDGSSAVDGSSADEDDGPSLDVSSPDGDGGSGNGSGEPMQACTQVDVLFVIDGSISMDVAQAKLQASLGSFVEAIEGSLLGETDFHIGVVTTTAYAHNHDGCSMPGSLIVETGGEGSSASTCGPFTGDTNYLTPADEPLAESFLCIAQIGLGNGNVELTAEAMLAALTGDGPAGCNTGFAREDALLVVVNVTDTDDPSAYPAGMGSTGGPTEWFDALVALRGGVETNIVMISIIPPAVPTCTVEGNWSPLFPGPLDAPRLTTFTELFTNHYIGDICAPDYGVLLGEALATIETGCDEFTPVG